MAAPSYTEDLTDISLMESGETGAAALNISGGGGGAPAFGADFGMQGNGCWDKAASNAERAILTNNTATGSTGTGVHIFQWGFVATPGVLDTLINRGVYVIAGTDSNNYVQYHVDGEDTLGAQGRVGKCYVYRYVTTAQTDRIPYRTVTGTPGATPDEFGYGLKTLATVKGSNFGQDAHRYGTGAYLTAGELISAGDASDDPCTFVGFNTQNDSVSNRWGILTSIGGSGYELQGKFAIGQNNSGTATLCRFRDSDKGINIVDTVHSESDFTEFIFDHASTRCEWNNINLTALGGWNKGIITVTANDPDVFFTGGTFTGLGVSTLQVSTIADGATWRACGEVTANGATLANSTIIHGASLIDAQDETSYNNSPSTEGVFAGGSGHANGDILVLDDDTVIVVDLVLAGTVSQFTIDATRSKVFGGTRTQVSTDGSGTGFTLTPDTDNYTESSGLIWNTAADPNGELDDMTFDTLTSSMGHAIEFGTSSPLTMTLTNCDFGTNYSAAEDGFVGNETFWFRDGSPTAITLNLVGCTGNFGYKTDGADINIIVSPVTALVRVIDENRAPYLGARVILKASDGTGNLPYQDVVTITRSGDTATVTHTAHGLATGKKVEIKGASQYDYNGVKTVTVTTANAYTFTMDSPYPTSPATGDLTLLTDAQDETSYANSPTTEGVFTGGTGYAVSDTIQLNKGITVTVDAIDSPGVVTQFTVNAGSQQTDPIYKDETLFQTGGSGTFGIIQSGYNNASAGATSITVSPTLAAGTGRKLLVWGGYYQSIISATITATYDGNSMNSINTDYNTFISKQELFEYDIPDVDSGSKNIVITFGGTRNNRSVMFAIIANAATGTEEAETNANIISATTADSNMTSTSADTIFVQGVLVGSTASAFAATNGATEELEQAFDASDGHIVYEIRTASGADTIGASWTTSVEGCKNSCVIAKGSGGDGSGTGFTLTPDTDNLDPGDIISTGVVLEGTTDSSGEISDSRSYSLDQPSEGVVRKATTSPIYKDSPISGDIDAADGLTIGVQMILDE